MNKFLILFLLVLPLQLSASEICEISSKICEEGAETRVIDGVDVYNDCWKYKNIYSCYQEDQYIDHCEILKNYSCTQYSSQECILLNQNNQCETYQTLYSCSELLDIQNEGVNFVEVVREITSDYLDTSSCDVYTSDANCSIIANECVEPEEEREIEGLLVFKECWKYLESYECRADELSNNCESYEENCTFESKQCLVETDNQCSHYERIYTCNETSEYQDQSLICVSQSYCINDDCAETGYDGDTGFVEAITQLNVVSQAGEELDAEEITIFNGQNQTCQKQALSYNSCCTNEGIGQDLELTSCKSEELALIEKRKEKQCRFIGGYCSKEKLWTCLEKTDSYCCYGSKIARVIQEQGRAQLGISWGSAQHPNCNGFTEDDFKRIDFSQVDLSELHEDVSEVIVDPNNEDEMELIDQWIRDAYTN